MLVSEIITEIRNETDTNSTKCSDSYILTGINLHYGELIMSILKERGDYNFTLTEATTNFMSSSGLVVGDVGFNGEYPWNSDILRIVRLEVSFDGSVFHPATVYDITDKLSRSEHTQSDINNTFSSNAPHVRIERGSFFVRPINTGTTISAGIHIWYEQRQTNLVTSDTPIFESNYHRLLVLTGAQRIMKRFRKEYNLNERVLIGNEILALKTEMMSFYTKQVDDNLFLTPAYINYN